MNPIQFFITVLVGMSLLACQSKPSSQTNPSIIDSTAQLATNPKTVADLEKQILALHDSVMPAMSDLIKLKKEVTQQLANLDKEPTSTDSHQRKQQGLAVKADLEKADESMMDWMHHYNGDTLTKLSEAQALAYLKGEQKRVTAMSRLMRKSITDAEAYLKSR